MFVCVWGFVTEDAGKAAAEQQERVGIAPIMMGVAWAILPTSSSVCMIFLMRAARGWPFRPMLAVLSLLSGAVWEGWLSSCVGLEEDSTAG